MKWPIPQLIPDTRYKGKTYRTRMTRPVYFNISGSIEWHYDLSVMPQDVYEPDALPEHNQQSNRTE